MEKNPVSTGTVGSTLGATYVFPIGAPSTVESIGGHGPPSLSTTALARVHSITTAPELYSTHLTCPVKSGESTMYYKDKVVPITTSTEIATEIDP